MLKLSKVIVIAMLLSHVAYADSLWSKDTPTLYNNARKFGVGDVITVIIQGQSVAVQEAGTNTSKQSGINADFYDMWDQYSINTDDNDSLRKMQNYRIGGGDSYRGTGATSRKSKVNAVMSAMVTEILENGNLVIVGEHSVNVNDETEIIRLSGIIRPEDISAKNDVPSHKIAHAQISVKGDGVVGAKQTPGIMSRMFNWVF
jgi:flagellar L-ring protein FlgH